VLHTAPPPSVSTPAEPKPLTAGHGSYTSSKRSCGGTSTSGASALAQHCLTSMSAPRAPQAGILCSHQTPGRPDGRGCCHIPPDRHGGRRQCCRLQVHLHVLPLLHRSHGSCSSWGIVQDNQVKNFWRGNHKRFLHTQYHCCLSCMKSSMD
jgi:hypothetical protein